MSHLRRLHVPTLPATGDVRVDGDEGHHLVVVLRARVGDRFGIFDGRGREVDAQVVQVGKRDATLRIVAEREPRRAARDVVLCTAVPRGQRMEWLIEKCTEAGVGRVVPLMTARGVRDRVSENVLRRWRRAAVEAAKQCGRADVPDVSSPASLVDAMATCRGRHLVIADPAADRELDDVVSALPGPLALLVGPEGGFDETEDHVARAAGALGARLGALILRIETAAVIATHAAARG